MKYSEMNGNQKTAYRNIKGVFNWEVGGWYNCIQDGCEEYIPDTLREAAEIIYNGAMNDAAGEGWYRDGGAPKEMRFAGTEFVLECIERMFKKDEDAMEIAEAKGWSDYFVDGWKLTEGR